MKKILGLALSGAMVLGVSIAGTSAPAQAAAAYPDKFPVHVKVWPHSSGRGAVEAWTFRHLSDGRDVAIPFLRVCLQGRIHLDGWFTRDCRFTDRWGVAIFRLHRRFADNDGLVRLQSNRRVRDWGDGNDDWGNGDGDGWSNDGDWGRDGMGRPCWFRIWVPPSLRNSWSVSRPFILRRGFFRDEDRFNDRHIRFFFRHHRQFFFRNRHYAAAAAYRFHGRRYGVYSRRYRRVYHRRYGVYPRRYQRVYHRRHRMYVGMYRHHRMYPGMYRHHRMYPGMYPRHRMYPGMYPHHRMYPGMHRRHRMMYPAMGMHRMMSMHGMMHGRRHGAYYARTRGKYVVSGVYDVRARGAMQH